MTIKKYDMDTRKTLSPEICKRITKKFKENKAKFSRNDFIDLAKKYDKNISAVTRILSYLEEKNKIAVVGEGRGSGGGWSFKIYQVVSGCDFDDSRDPDYRTRVSASEKQKNESALRLHKAMDRVSRINIRAKALT